MKLSEILNDWPKKKPIEGMIANQLKNREFNTALTSCAREIDREALAEAMNESQFKSMNIDEQVDYFISTMPTWLKRIEE
jgi:hypothetical protein